MIVQGGNGGVSIGEGEGEGGRWLSGFGSLIRRKQVDPVHYREHPQLARKLSAVDLVGIGNSSISCFKNYGIIKLD
jgi:cationic amino acid transporter 1